MKWVIIKSIHVYQRINSVFWRYKPSILFYPNCRFYPTCSEYSIEAIEKYGLLLGTTKALKRILRCNPLFKGGLDEV